MTKPKLALNPKHPERICWGCDLSCPADDLRCGNGTIRAQHPCELLGEDWLDVCDKGLHGSADCNRERGARRS